MGTCTYGCLMNVINIGNSIIGVSILAMPYCFRKCGILLSLVLILVSGLLTRLACYLLLKSAIMARRRNFEFLAFHIFGSTGKLAVEISVVGFLIGVCIAFFVVIGDLGPPLAAEFLEIQVYPNLRTNVLVLVGLCVALPLGMLRKIDSLTSLSALSIAFYGFLVLKIFTEAIPNLILNEWWYEVNWWQSDGILPCLPIFSMALSCQTQLFEFFDTLNDPSIKRMQTVVSGAVHLCSAVYILVGTFGYIAFHNKALTGNALILLTPSLTTELIKLGFILTVAVSFPLCLFPCRSSLHSLLFKQAFGHHDITINVIPDHRFRILTVSLVIVTIGIAIMLPNIEFVLGIIGSTIGTLICLIFPAIMFIRDTSKNTTEKRLAQILMCIGLFILIACTYTTLKENESKGNVPIDSHELKKITNKMLPESLLIPSSVAPQVSELPVEIKKVMHPIENNNMKKIESFTKEQEVSNDQKRLEPPVPQEPELKAEHVADLDPQALQKEDKELQKDEKKIINVADSENKNKDIDKQQQLLIKLEQQHKEQKLILEQQKEVLQELKRHKESHEEQKKVNFAENSPNIINIPEVSTQNLKKGESPDVIKSSLVSNRKDSQSLTNTEERVNRNDTPKRKDFESEKILQQNSTNVKKVEENMNVIDLQKNAQKVIPLESKAIAEKLEYKEKPEQILSAGNIKNQMAKNYSENLIADLNSGNVKLKAENKLNPVHNASIEQINLKLSQEKENLNPDKIDENNNIEQQIKSKNEAVIAKREILQNKLKDNY